MIGPRDFELSIAAVRDLGAIYDFTSADNADGARRFLSQITGKIAHIAATGFPGVPRDALSSGLKAMPFKNNCIYFRVYQSHIYIVRIIHGRQDISSKDFSESDM